MPETFLSILAAVACFTLSGMMAALVVMYLQAIKRGR
jgi:hypothetical protein